MGARLRGARGAQLPSLVGTELTSRLPALGAHQGSVHMGLQPGRAQSFARPPGQLRDRVRTPPQLRCHLARCQPVHLGEPEDPLPLLGKRAERRVHQVAIQLLTPGDRARTRGVGGLDGLDIVDGGLPRPPQTIDGLVAHGPHQVGGEPVVRPSPAGDRPQDLDERLLGHVLAVVRSDEASRLRQRRPEVAAVERGIGTGVAVAHRGEQLLVGHGVLMRSGVVTAGMRHAPSLSRRRICRRDRGTRESSRPRTPRTGEVRVCREHDPGHQSQAEM